MKRISTILLIVTISVTSLIAQEKFNIRLVPTNTSDNAETLCFDTQFKNVSEADVVLSGQNYRLFYDALQLKFLKEKVRAHLPNATYSQIDVNQSLHNIDARGYGDLKFSENLGFLNYSVRMKEDESELITLPSFSGWISTTNVCFQASDAMGPINIIWARPGLTDGYATAFTEISTYDEEGDSRPAKIQVYQDFIKLSDGTGVNDPMVLQSTQNH